MSRYKHWAFILSVMALSGSAQAFDERNEISAAYRSFYADVGGRSALMARYRNERYEFQLASLTSDFALEVAYAPRFDLKTFFKPRLILGAAYAFGTAGPVAGVGLSFPIVHVGGGSLGLGLDSYIYGSIHAFKRIGVNPVIPLSLTYLF